MDNKHYSVSIWQYSMLAISVLALALLAVQSFFILSNNISETLYVVDTVICTVFLFDFCIQLARAPSRRRYLKWGWLDLVSSIPMLPALRIARLARIARIIRVLRGAKAGKHLLTLAMVHRARSTFGAVIVGAFVLLLLSAIAIVSFEQTLSAREAFWWCLFTLITGEYGDFCPPSTEGRIIAALLMTAGVAVFGTFTASVASYFLEEEQREDEQRDIATLGEIGKLRSEIAELKSILKGENTNGEHSQESR